jgi:tetratricopeptide (TPR) repeat protein/capsular polysaccharide biosynthesis protein
MRGKASANTIKLYLAQGKWSQAIAACTQALEEDPNLLELYVLLAKGLVHQGKFKEAIAAYQKVLGSNLNQAEIHAELGILYSKRQELVKAAWHYQQALLLKPDWAQLHYNLAVVMHQLGDWNAAVNQYRRAIALKGDYATVYFNLGVLHDQRGELEAAIENYHQAINLQSDYVKAYSNLGSTLAKQKKFTAAIEIYQQGLKLDPSWATLHNNLGQVFWFNEQPELALASFEYAVALEPNMVLAYHNLGKLWQQQGNYPTAIQCFQQVIEIEPNNIWAYSHGAEALIVKDNFPLALKYLSQAIALQPTFVKVYCQRMRSLPQEDLLAKAKVSCAYFLEALQQKQDKQEIYHHLGQTYYYLGDILFEYGGIKQAEIYYQQALQIKPDDADLYLRLGNCLAKQQRLDAAIAIYHMGLTLQPNHPQICFQLGKVLEKQQRAEEAINYYEAVLQQELNEDTDNWKQLPNFFPSDEHIPKLPRGVYYHSQDWVRDCQLDDFNYTQVNWGEPIAHEALTRQKQPELLSPSSTLKTPPSECGGVNCPNCMSKLIDYFEPVQLGKNAYICSPLNSSPVKSPTPFVVTIPEGRVWAAPQQNSWIICNALAVITPDNYLLGDVSRYYPWYLPGCPYQERTNHTILTLEEIPAVEEIEGTVAVLSGLAGHVYYHWMIDILPRIELLRRSGIELEQIDWFLVNNIDRSFQRETLNLLGIPVAKILASDRYSHIQAQELIVPSFPGHLDWVSPGTIEFLRQTFLPQITLTKTSYPERIYISRARARGRQVINEQEVIDILETWDFQTFYLEEMSVREQVALFAAAKVIVAAHGSGLTNLVFSNAGTKVIELFSPHYVRTDYWIITQQLQIQHYYLLGNSFDCPPLRHLMYQNALTEDILVDLNSLRLIMRIANITN